MIEKKVRMTVEISVLVHEISRSRGPFYHRLPESLRKQLTSSLSGELVERQSRLQRALLKNAEALRMYLLYAVTSDFDLEVGSAINSTLELPPEEDILKSVSASMANEDELY